MSHRKPVARAVLATMCIVSSLTAVAGQGAFSTATDAVATYVTVVGGGRTIASGLTVRDFEIRDNGTLQPITQFEAGTLPITIAVMLDDSPSLSRSRPSTRAAAAALVRRLRPGDRATVGFFNRTVRLEEELTGDPEEILRRLALPSTMVAGTALWDAVNAGMAVLEDEPGRRVVLLLTDGDDNSSEATVPAIAAMAARSGVMLYAIGLRGTDRRLSQTLSALTRATGGWFFELKPDDSLEATFQRVADELHSQYLIGFSPQSLDGTVHTLSVKVKRSGLTARSRTSYLAQPAEPPPAPGF